MISFRSAGLLLLHSDGMRWLPIVGFRGRNCAYDALTGEVGD